MTEATSGKTQPSTAARGYRKALVALLGFVVLASIRTSSVNLSLTVSPNRMASAVTDGRTLRAKSLYSQYVPSKIEEYIVSHTKELKLDKKVPELVPTCHLWTDKDSTPYHSDLHDLVKDLEHYYKKIEDFSLAENVTDIRKHLNDSDEDICDKLELGQLDEGLPSLFPNEKLSYTKAGWVEPLMPPMRHPNWCLDGTQESLASIDYLVHDFAHMCRKMKPSSRIVLFDMGASLMFSTKWPSPVLQLVRTFQKFGMPFDHIYAYELNQLQPSKVFEMVPDYMRAAYHWINVGVDPDPESQNNPFKLLWDTFNEEDLIIVKMDIDTPSLERELANQLLNDERLLNIIDHFYFEHHVNQQELARYWGPTQETVEDSLTLFYELRKKGVASHFWT